jgi:D-alanyl-D-alanine carboxypeptidase
MDKHLRRLCPALVALVLVPAAMAAPDSTQIPERLRESFQARLGALATEHKLPGATAAFVLPDGRFASFATGFADLELRLPMQPASRLMSGSTGKTFVAALALALEAEGKLALDDKVSRWLGEEEWFPRLPNGADITLRSLLNHSSGLPDHIASEPFREAVRSRMNDGGNMVMPPRMLVGFILDKSPLFPVGQGYAYTDTNYIVAGLALERAGGFIYDHEVVRRFIYPHRLTLTSPQEGVMHPGLAQGYVHSELVKDVAATTLDRGIFRWNPISEWTGGGFVTNATDLARWAKILFEGKAMEAPYLEEMLGSANVHSRPEGFEYGLGVAIAQSPYGRQWRHLGGYPGYLTSMAYYPDHGVAVAVQTNTDAVGRLVIKETGEQLAAVVLDRCIEDRSLCPRPRR